MEFTARITEDTPPRITVQQGIEWQQFKAAHAGESFTLLMRPWKKRSTRANGYMWTLHEMIAKALRGFGHTEITAEKVHEISKLKCNPVEMLLHDEIVIIGGSTKGLSKPEFFDFIQRYRHYWEPIIGFRLPEPHEQLQIETI